MTHDDHDAMADPWSLPPSGRPTAVQDGAESFPFWPLPALLILAVLPFGLLWAIVEGDLGPAVVTPFTIAAICLGALLPVTAGGFVVYGVILIAMRIVAAVGRRRHEAEG